MNCEYVVKTEFRMTQPFTVFDANATFCFSNLIA